MKPSASASFALLIACKISLSLFLYRSGLSRTVSS
nr:MAG TPA: hypothetical protein [Caudoviricetes sp.]DAX27265.1 MAG TPA: hypothetical protein [Caudoviricetes sp.]